jgi:hypothetical protein
VIHQKGRGCARFLLTKRGKIGLLISGFILALVCVASFFIYPTAKFIYLTDKFPYLLEHLVYRVQSWIKKTWSKFLQELKVVARLIQNLTEPQRCLAIKIYDAYINMNPHSDRYVDRVLKLYLIQRLVFEVPNNYPLHDVTIFVFWAGYQESNLSDPGNLLWPLQYENGQLALVTLPWGIHSYYAGVREYDYFVKRFPLRPKDELK